MNTGSRAKWRGFSLACILLVLPAVQADDGQSLPNRPKPIPIDEVELKAQPFGAQANVTLLVTDPLVAEQMTNTGEPTSVESSRANQGFRGNAQNSAKVEIIKLPISHTSAQVTNTSEKFLFVDTTNREGDSSHLSGGLQLSREDRRLQVEAARQAAASAKAH